MPFFEHAGQFNIHGGNFYDVKGNYNNNVTNTHTTIRDSFNTSNVSYNNSFNDNSSRVNANYGGSPSPPASGPQSGAYFNPPQGFPFQDQSFNPSHSPRPYNSGGGGHGQYSPPHHGAPSPNFHANPHIPHIPHNIPGMPPSANSKIAAMNQKLASKLGGPAPHPGYAQNSYNSNTEIYENAHNDNSNVHMHNYAPTPSPPQGEYSNRPTHNPNNPFAPYHSSSPMSPPRPQESEPQYQQQHQARPRSEEQYNPEPQQQYNPQPQQQYNPEPQHQYRPQPQEQYSSQPQPPPTARVQPTNLPSDPPPQSYSYASGPETNGWGSTPSEPVRSSSNSSALSYVSPQPAELSPIDSLLTSELPTMDSVLFQNTQMSKGSTSTRASPSPAAQSQSQSQPNNRPPSHPNTGLTTSTTRTATILTSSENIVSHNNGTSRSSLQAHLSQPTSPNSIVISRLDASSSLGLDLNNGTIRSRSPSPPKLPRSSSLVDLPETSPIPSGSTNYATFPSTASEFSIPSTQHREQPTQRPRSSLSASRTDDDVERIRKRLSREVRFDSPVVSASQDFLDSLDVPVRYSAQQSQSQSQPSQQQQPLGFSSNLVQRDSESSLIQFHSQPQSQSQSQGKPPTQKRPEPHRQETEVPTQVLAELFAENDDMDGKKTGKKEKRKSFGASVKKVLLGKSNKSSSS